MKGESRRLETWTCLKKKLWSRHWEQSQGLWSNTTEPAELWGEGLKVRLDFFNRFRNVTFRPLPLPGRRRPLRLSHLRSVL